MNHRTMSAVLAALAAAVPAAVAAAQSPTVPAPPASMALEATPLSDGRTGPGVVGETGTLDAGKDADILAVPGNVLQDIRATERPLLVMKQGAIVRGGE